MTIEEIKTYDEVDAYCEEVGYENLTDEDIDALCKKIWEIEKALEEADASKFPKGRIALSGLHVNGAVNRVNHLRNCTEERRFANSKKAMEEADREAPGVIRHEDGMTPHEEFMERVLH